MTPIARVAIHDLPSRAWLTGLAVADPIADIVGRAHRFAGAFFP